MFTKLIALFLTGGLAITASDAAETETAEEQQAVQMLVYQIEEQGVGIWFSRILVTDDFIRLDEPDGERLSSYTLYERKSGVIYNVDLEEPTAFEIIPPKELAELPMKVDVSIEEQPYEQDEASGLKLQKRSLKANGEHCIDISVTDGQMASAREAMNELYLSLAKEHARTLLQTPDEYVSACDIAEHVKATDFKYGKGVMVKNAVPGLTEALVDFSEKVLVPASLFKLPDGVKVIKPSEIGSL